MIKLDPFCEFIQLHSCELTRSSKKFLGLGYQLAKTCFSFIFVTFLSLREHGCDTKLNYVGSFILLLKRILGFINLNRCFHSLKQVHCVRQVFVFKGVIFTMFTISPFLYLRYENFHKALAFFNQLHSFSDKLLQSNDLDRLTLLPYNFILKV